MKKNIFSFNKKELFVVWMKFVIVDMEGVLVDGEYLPRLAKLVKREKKVEEITLEGIRGKIKWEDGLKKRIELLRGINYKDALKVADKMPLTKNAKEFCKKIKEMGFKIVMITGGFTLVSDRIKKELGLDYVIANEMVFNDSKLSGVKINVVDKAKGFKDFFGDVDKKNVVAIVDGANDLDLFKIAGLKIAFNAQPIVKKTADLTVDGKDMKKLIPIIEKYFSTSNNNGKDD